MKNTIKNYIKIIGLAAVPFGTAQAGNYEIRVTQERKPDAEHFRISIKMTGMKLRTADIIWPHDEEYPKPIFEPNGFVRIYDEELRREGSIIDLSKVCRKGCNLLDEVEVNCVEWMRWYYKNGANDFEKLPCFKEFLKSQFSRVSAEQSWLRVLHAFKKGKSALEIVRDAQKSVRRAFEDHNVSPLVSPYVSGIELPKGCSCVCYKISLTGITVFLMKDPHRLLSDSEYVLLIKILCGVGERGSIFVSSDVQTVLSYCGGFHQASVYCATNEILDTNLRRKLCEQLLPERSECFLSRMARCFVRVRHHANEKSMGDVGFKFLPRQCLEVESGRVTGAWFDGKRADIDLSESVFTSVLDIVEYAKKFKYAELLQAIEDLSKEDEKESIYEGAVNMKLLEKLEKGQVKPQDEIKIKEKTKKSEEDPFALTLPMNFIG